MSEIEIRPVTEVSDTEKIEIIQRKTWRMRDLDVLPSRFLHVLQHNGACLLGAYDGDEIVGFVFGVLGTVEGLTDRVDEVAAARLQMYSVLMGVAPEYQSMGIGYRLKIAQREFALRVGVRLVTWTYDPLESRNAYLNIGKLGVVCQSYKRDYHGPMSGLNVGLPSDRFHIEWWVTSNRVKGRLTSGRGALGFQAFISGGAKLVNEAKVSDDGVLRPANDFLHEDSRLILVEIPSALQAIKEVDLDAAQAWRLHTRNLFEHYFERQYLVTDFIRRRVEHGIDRSFYALTSSAA
jgi:predicted GNAT superfamily acetyltransferase